MAHIATSPLLRHVYLSLGASLLYYGASSSLPVAVQDVFDSIGHVLGLLLFVFTSAGLLPQLVLGSSIELVKSRNQMPALERLKVDFNREFYAPSWTMKLWVYSVPSAIYGLWYLFHKVWQ